MGWAPFDEVPGGQDQAPVGKGPTAVSTSTSVAQPGEGAPTRGGESTKLRGTYYYAHSYAAESPATTAWSEGVAVELRWGSFVGCQFHPEKSGADGERYLRRVLEEALCRSPA